MEANEKPSFYAILPAYVRYEKRLKPAERLLFAEISALTNKFGYCTASNSYFSELYETTKETVSRWIGHLSELGFVRLEMVYDGKQIKGRRIWIAEKVMTPIDEKVMTPIDEKVMTPIDEKVKDNNTRYNNTRINNIFVDSSEKTQVAEHHSFVDADATTTRSDGNLFDSEQQTEQAGNHSLKTNNERGTDGNSSGRNKDSNIPPAADEGNEKRFRAVAEVFNRVFADCPAVRKVSLKSVAANKKRKRLIPAAWAIAKDRVMTGWVDSDGLIDGEKVSAKHLIQWFEAYFMKCLEDPFINGQQPRSKGHENWKPDFETLLRPAEMEKRVYED